MRIETATIIAKLTASAATEMEMRGIAPRNSLMAWLIWEMGTQLGLCPRSNVPPRPLRAHSRLQDLYWLTHLFFLASRFGALPLDARDWAAETEELRAALLAGLPDDPVEATGALLDASERLDRMTELARTIRAAAALSGRHVA